MSREIYAAITRRAWELLGDGEWHDREQIIRELSKVVPPGPAMRRAERDRRKPTVGRGSSGASKHWVPPAERHVTRTDDQLVAIGQRSYVRDALKNVGFEITGAPHTKNRQVRMKATPRAVATPAFRTINSARHEIARLRDLANEAIIHLQNAGQQEIAAKLREQLQVEPDEKDIRRPARWVPKPPDSADLVGSGHDDAGPRRRPGRPAAATRDRPRAAGR